MNRRNPPPVARWMLEHLTLGADSDALTGDVLEEFLSGRSRFWYWRQTLAAIALGFLREVRRRRSILAFALLWTFPVPALMLSYDRLLNRSALFAGMWSMPWPWSTVCDAALALNAGLVFLWIGMAIYLLLSRWIGPAQTPPRVSRGLLAGSLAYALLFAAFFAIPHAPHPTDIRTVTVASIYANPWLGLMCMPGFLALFVSIWIALPRQRRTKAPAAS